MSTASDGAVPHTTDEVAKITSPAAVSVRGRTTRCPRNTASPVTVTAMAYTVITHETPTMVVSKAP